MSLAEADELRDAATPTSTSAARARRSPRTAPRWSASSTRAPRSSTTATACAPRRASAASSARSPTPASCPPTCARCSARARGRFAGSRCRAIPPTSRRPTAPCSTSSPTTSRSRAGSATPASGSPSRGCRRGSAGWATASARGWACGFNAMVAARRAARAGRHRPRPPRRGLGRLAVPRDRGDGRRVRRDRRLAAAQRAGQHGERRDVGVDPPRRRRRHRPLDPRRDGLRRRRHAAGRAEARARADRRSRAPASCATPTPATSGRSRSPAQRGVRIPMREE